MLQLYGHSATAEIGERYFSDDNNKVDKSVKKHSEIQLWFILKQVLQL